MLEKINKIIIPLSIIATGIIITAAFVFVNQEKIKGPAVKELPAQQVAEETINYINENFLAQGLVASLIDISDAGSVYKIRLKIGEQEHDSYVGKDGKFLFPEGIDLTIKPQSQEAPVVQEIPEEKEFSQATLEELAKCLSQKGAKFYGTDWCSYCQKQKEVFGEAAQYLPYIECDSNKGTPEELALCQKDNVGGIPDWRFPNGEQRTGVVQPEELAELSGCQLK